MDRDTYWLDAHGITWSVWSAVPGNLPASFPSDPNPLAPPTIPTRFQVYLLQLGQDFYYETLTPQHTIFPAPDGFDSTGYTLVDVSTGQPPPPMDPSPDPNPYGVADQQPPDEDDNDIDGLPVRPFDPSSICNLGEVTADECQALRRVFTVAVLQCQAQGVQGSGTYEVDVGYVNFFLTQVVPPPSFPGEKAKVYSELVGPAAESGSGRIIVNVQLIE